MDFINFLTDYKKKTGDSNRMIAEKLNVSKSIIDKWLEGRKKPKHYSIMGIKAILTGKPVDTE